MSNLCETSYTSEVWVIAKDGSAPCNAVVGGKTAGGQPIYVVRAVCNDSLTPGKLVASQGKAYVSWGGREHAKHVYEVLVISSNNWVKASGDSIPRGVFRAGYTENGEALYVGRAWHQGELITGKVQKSIRGCLVPYAGKEYTYENYEILMTI